MEVELCTTLRDYFCWGGILLLLTLYPLLFPFCDVKLRNDSRSHQQLGLLPRSPNALDSCPSLCLYSFICVKPGTEFNVCCGLHRSIESITDRGCSTINVTLRPPLSQVFQLVPKFKRRMAMLNPRGYSHACCKYLEVR